MEVSTRQRRLLSDRQRRSWLRLIRTENVGPASFRALINRYGSAEAALEALPSLSRAVDASRSIYPPGIRSTQNWKRQSAWGRASSPSAKPNTRHC